MATIVFQIISSNVTVNTTSDGDKPAPRKVARKANLRGKPSRRPCKCAEPTASQPPARRC